MGSPPDPGYVEQMRSMHSREEEDPPRRDPPISGSSLQGSSSQSRVVNQAGSECSSIPGQSDCPDSPYRSFNHVVQHNTLPQSTRFYLCLRSSEYISKTIVPSEYTHQFLSSDVQFMLNDGLHTFNDSHSLQRYQWHQLNKSNSVFSMQTI